MSAIAELPLVASVAAPPRSGAAPTCRHCGARSPAGEFCCAGCAYVFRLLHEQNLTDYYRLKDPVTAPADPSLLHPRDFAWIVAAQREAETGAVAPSPRDNATGVSHLHPSFRSTGHATPSLRLGVQGVSCAGCVWLIEKIFSRQPGAGRIEVGAQTGELQLWWTPGRFDAAAFARALQSFNYLVGPAGAASAVPESRALARRAGLCAAFTMNVMLFTLPVYFGMEETYAYADLFALLSFLFATLSLLAGGTYFLGRAARALRAGVIHLDLPIGLGIAAAYLGSAYGWIAGREEFVYFDFVSAFITLMLVGRWAQTAAVERNQQRLLRQQPVAPRVRRLEADGSETDIAAEDLRPGERFAVAPGGTVPVGAKLETATAPLGLAWINGEAEPRVFRAGQPVPAGAQNVGRVPLTLTATEGWAGSLLAELLRPAVRAEFRHRLIERVIQGYLIAILASAAGSGGAWLWATGDAARAGAVVVSVLVVSCPCALGLAFPLADEIATVALRRRGVFVRAADLWPRLRQLRRVVFDKTGTLTVETPVLRAPAALAALSPAARAALLALVQDSPHPVSRSLHESLLALGADTPLAPATGSVQPCSPQAGPPGTVHESVGDGLELRAGGARWRLGRAEWALAAGMDSLMAAAHSTPEAPATTSTQENATVLSRDGVPVACFHFADTVRSGAADELAALARRGLDVFILSGDRPEKVFALAAALGLPPARALGALSPRDKAAWLDAHDAARTLMLGDGANDSLAFDRALCRGTPAVTGSPLAPKADFYWLGRGLGGIRALLETDDARRRTQATLLAFMVAYNLLAVGLAVAGRMNPLLAAILMPVSSLATLALVGWGMRGVMTARP
jgi:Cu2+-exporting ATPase